MTQIKYNDEYIEINGHAGDDSVCTAVSILTYTLLYELDKYQSEGKITELDVDLQDGYVKISFENEHGGDVNVMLDVIYAGFNLLALEHPDHIIFV